MNGGGNDILLPGNDLVNDTVEGGLWPGPAPGSPNPGGDTVDYSDVTAGVTIKLPAGTATGRGTDTLTAIHHAGGGSGGDTITGLALPEGGGGSFDQPNNVLIGGPGDDTLRGEPNGIPDDRGGNDTLVGGQHADVMIGGPHG